MTARASYDGRSKIRLAVIFYSVCTALALLWSWLIGRPHLVYDPARSTWGSAATGALAGLACGLLTAWLSRLALPRFGWARHLFGWFAEVLAPLNRRDAILLACLSGVGEELLFRGPLLQTVGLLPSSLIFGLLHLPPQRSLWPWTAMAAILGLLFGQLARWSGNLAGPITAHVVINGLNLLEVVALIRRARPGDEKLPPACPEPSMEHHASLPSSSAAPDPLRADPRPGQPGPRERR